MLGKLTREQESHSGLDLAGRQGRLLVVTRKLRGFKGESFEDIVDERVQDGHASLGDASVGVDLLEDLVDVGRVRLDSLGLSLAASCLLGGGLGCLLSNCGCLCHFRLNLV